METNQRHENLSVRSAALNWWIKMHGIEVWIETVQAEPIQNSAQNVLVCFCIRVIEHPYALVCDSRTGATYELLTWHVAFYCTKPVGKLFYFDIIIVVLCISTSTLRSQWPCGLRHRYAAACLLRLWVRIPRGHGYLSVMSVVCCQLEVSATSCSPVQRIPNDCGVSLCVT
jgi:hypothetical protein